MKILLFVDITDMKDFHTFHRTSLVGSTVYNPLLGEVQAEFPLDDFDFELLESGNIKVTRKPFN